ncbi:TPA: hypothetical protein H3G36_000902 [Escherichia coli]|jgi:hypothetical protein|nr:hypothetical protein [Escherichia coli]EMS09835.1 Plasmid segregation protein parM [Escherichia coli O127:H27 str. C43/90]KDU34076.1 stbA family protein [Escherichia coli 3-073-06_S4_C1]KDY23346.1 stbA family protein [Escherichia coli 2-316-03_S4_C2]KDZ78876.1 stbA family protein [Escherichia coli 3-073-06_S4_C3]KEN28924.1 stbA family protein [Escherichia coli 7-233-03_S3_C2]
MKICIDDGSTNTKLAWTENGERRNAISPNSFKSEWSAPFGGTQPANYMLDGVRYGFDPVSDRFVQTTDTQYQYSDVNVIAIHHALVKSGITPQEVDVVVTLPLSEYFDTNAQPDIANINRKKANDARMLQAYRIAQAALQAKPSDGLVRAVRFYEQVKRENPPVETGAWKDAVDWVLKEACQSVNIGIKGE